MPDCLPPCAADVTPCMEIDHGERHASVKLSSGHMPHLVNIVDFHRLLTALSGGGCVSPKAIGFDPACAGHGPAEKERTYIEAYRHFCRVWPV